MASMLEQGPYNTIIGGDFNARTGTLRDFVCESEEDKTFLNLSEDYEIDKITSRRNNQDTHTNSYGEKLIDMSIARRMRILKGRTIGDLQGKFTYIGYNGVSTIDYVLASENILIEKLIHSLKVEDLSSLSDHRPLTLKLNYTRTNKNKQETIDLIKIKRTRIQNIETYKTELNKMMDMNTISSLNILQNSTNEQEINDTTSYRTIYKCCN